MKPVKIPQRVDDLPHVSIFSADEFFPMIIGLVGGMLVGQAFVMTVIGFASTYWYRQYRESHADGYFSHMIYWWGLLTFRSKTFLNPMIRRLLP